MFKRPHSAQLHSVKYNVERILRLRHIKNWIRGPIGHPIGGLFYPSEIEFDPLRTSSSRRTFSTTDDLFNWDIDPKWDLPDPLLPPAAQIKPKSHSLNISQNSFIARVSSGKVNVPTVRFSPHLSEKNCPRGFQVVDEVKSIDEAIDGLYDGMRVGSITVSKNEYGTTKIIKKGELDDPEGEEPSKRFPNSSSHNLEMLTEAYAVNLNELEETLNIEVKEKMKEKIKDKIEEENNRESDLTPAQLFFLENREKLLERAQDYHNHKIEHFDELSDEDPSNGTSSHFDTFYRDPVVRLPKNHLWDFGTSKDEIPDEEVELEQGRMPSVDDLVRILVQERIDDIRVVDLEKCGRRDLGVFLILGTGKTGIHCERVAKVVSQLIRKLEIPYVSTTTYCWGSNMDNWVIAHCGPFQCHILTSEMRTKFRIEDALLAPHEHFRPEKFAGYFDCLSSSPPPFVVDYVENLQKTDAELQKALVKNVGFNS